MKNRMNLLVHFVIYGHSSCFESSQIALAYGSCNFENFQNITRAHKSRNALVFIRFPIHTGLYIAIHGYTQLYKAIYSYTRLYTAIHSYTQFYRAIHSYTWLYTAIQGYTLLYTAL